MKNNIKNMLGLGSFLIGLAFLFSGCVEHRYYETNHHHSREWYEHHQQAPPQGMNFELDVHQ